MKIGILTNTYPPNLNGVSNAVKSLENALKNQGHEVYIATSKIDSVKYPAHILPLKSAELPKKISPDLKLPYFSTAQITEFFGDNKIEIIHTHDTVVGAADGMVAAVSLGVPCVHTYHTLIESYEYFNFPGYKTLIRNLTKDICNSYDHVIAPSSKVYNYLLQLAVKVPISKIYNILSDADLDIKIDLKFVSEFRKKFKIAEDDFCFITFCRIAKEKSIDTGIFSLAPILKKYPKTKYLICGWGPEIKSLQSLVSSLELQNQIIFTGKYTRDHLSSLASLAKVFLFTSTTENLPTNIFEACSLRLPVVSIDDSSVDFILKNGQNSLIVNSTDLSSACKELYLNGEKLVWLAANAFESAKKISASKEPLNQHLSLYRRLIEGKKLQANQQIAASAFKNITETFYKFRANYQKIIESYINFR